MASKDTPTLRSVACEQLPQLVTPEWGWTSYRRTGWISSEFPDNKIRRLYEARFRTEGSARGGFVAVIIQFWAARPILALRAIAEGEAEPITYDDTVVN